MKYTLRAGTIYHIQEQDGNLSGELTLQEDLGVKKLDQWGTLAALYIRDDGVELFVYFDNQPTGWEVP